MNSTEQLVAKAIEAKDDKRYQDALQLCDKALAIDAGSAHAWSQRGNILGFLGNILDAIFSFLKALTIDPEDPVAHAGLEQCQRIPKARMFWTHFEEVAINRALVFSKTHDHHIAADWYHCAIFFNDQNGDYYLNLGNALLKSGQYEYATQTLKTFLKKFPQQEVAFIGIGNAMLALERFQEAQAFFERALQVSPDNGASWNGLITCMLANGEEQAASQLLGKALSRAPRNLKLWRLQARCMMKQKDYSAAFLAAAKGLHISYTDRELLSIRADLLKNGLVQYTHGKTQMPLGREIQVGDVLDSRYEIKAVHKGGMGIVYVAWDNYGNLNFPVALKTFQARFSFDSKLTDLFYEEAATWIGLGGHRNIVQAYMVETIDGKPYILLYFVDGPNLRQRIDANPFVLFP